jgi:hypothetical protein
LGIRLRGLKGGHVLSDNLGLIDYYGEMIEITWDEYLSLSWSKPNGIEFLKIPTAPKK